MKFPKVSMAAALGVLAVYALFVWWMLTQVNSSNWTRLTYVYGSVSGIVLIAAGVVLGTAAQQQNVQAAKQDAANAKEEAAGSAADAAVGRNLEDSMKTLKMATGEQGDEAPHLSKLIGAGPGGTPDARETDLSESVLDYLLELATTVRARHEQATG